MLKMRKVGKVKDAHGLRGDLAVLIFSKDVSWLKQLQVFGLSATDSEQDLKTFNVEKAKPFKEGLILKPEGIVDRTQAEKLKGQLFYIPEELLESQEGETIYLSEIQGFQVENPQGEKLGTVTGFSSNLAQDLLLVDKLTGGQAEIPFVEDFIVEIDFEGQRLILDLPEGIWDLQAL